MEEVPDEKWRQLADIWTAYVRGLEGQHER
jgi:hypothetical protein